MTRLHRTFRTLLTGLILFALLTGAVLYALTRVLEHTLASQRSWSGIAVRFYEPSVSPFLAIRADSVVIGTASARWLFTKPVFDIDDWGGFKPSNFAFMVHVDSISVSWRGSPQTADEAVPFPSSLVFPVGVGVEWRILTMATSAGGGVAIGPARLESRGRQAAHGNFPIRFLSPSLQPEATVGSPRLDASVDARWGGGRVLRYRVRATSPGRDTVFVSGIRDMNDLGLGFDSLHLMTVRPSDWWPALQALGVGAAENAGENGPALASPLEAITEVTLDAKADWHRDSLNLTGRFVSAAVEPLEAAVWALNARFGPQGGRFELGGAGETQEFKFAGSWSQPDAWYKSPRFDLWRGEASGTVRGGMWHLGGFDLPLDFDLPSARLDSGLRLTARMLTSDATRIDLRWNGRQPHRLEIAGDVARGERWAVAWTHDQIDYESARVRGVWENAALDITAHVRAPRAYGASADSLEAVNRVTSRGYFLRRGRVFRGQETFTGSGEVLWENAAGEHAVSLQFDAHNPDLGRAALRMHVPGPIELVAENLDPTRFPYEPLHRYQSLAPRLQGRFYWDHLTGVGSTNAHARFSAVDSTVGPLHTSISARWRSDSLHVDSVELSTGNSRLSGTAYIPFNGRQLKTQGTVPSLMGGTWWVRAQQADLGQLLSLARLSTELPGGTLTGEMGFTPATGMTGLIRLANLRPAPPTPQTSFHGVSALEVRGMGDSLRVDATLPSASHSRYVDTLFAIFTGLNSRTPSFRIESRSVAGLSAEVVGVLPNWTGLSAAMNMHGGHALGPGLGRIENLKAAGRMSGTLGRDFLDDLRLTEGVFSFRHVSDVDTQHVAGTPVFAAGVLRVPDLVVTNGRGQLAIGNPGSPGGRLKGNLWYDPVHEEARVVLQGSRFSLVLPRGDRVRADELATNLEWSRERGLVAAAEARNGFVALPGSPARVETGFDHVLATVTMPPAHSSLSPTLKLDGRMHDFFFQRKWGWRDATAYFTGIGRGGSRPSGSVRRTRAWDLDLNLEATGTRNRIDTDVLRMTFTGDARLAGTYPYLLVYGKVSGLQGEVGQARQAYALRDFEIKWDNVTLEDGTLHVEGEKRVRSDCRADTRQTCQIFIRLDGRLEDVGFAYETDCTQNTGEPVPPSVLINSMAQGCYVSETPGGEGNYGSAAFAMLEPALNDRLSRGVSRGSGGFIKSTQVSGLSALIGSDSTGLESVALEVESRSVYRTSLKGRAGYHPETKLANPMEYRLAAEYRPPLERITQDSVWRHRLKNRFTVEAAVETRPEGRDIDEERRVRQRAGLRYRHRFWDLW